MPQRTGKNTILLPTKPSITGYAAAVGKKEAEGPLGKHFDYTDQDTYFGQKTWEQGERKMQQIALEKLLEKADCLHADVGLVFSGDLLNQCIGSSFTLRNMMIMPKLSVELLRLMAFRRERSIR